jgi:hypoxanthine phosphoribosyltransferase
VAAVRSAVRRGLDDLAPGSLVLVACSGGADSSALAGALAFVAPRRGLRAGLLTVDHAWDESSARRAEQVADFGRGLGLDPVEVLRAPSPRSEAAARDNRRSALAEAARRLGAACVLLGHTLDDQAETVLLRLARGSGARSLAGIPPADDLVRRPLLAIRRAQTRAACLAEGVRAWEDPTNADPAFTRARVRHRVLPVLEAEVGPGVAEALARTADLLRADADALDADAAAALDRIGADTAGPGGADTAGAGPGGAGADDREGSRSVTLEVAALAALSPAVRTRALRRAAIAAGASASALRAEHVWAVEELVTRWRGQRPVPMPSGVRARRHDGRITLFAPAEAREDHDRAAFGRGTVGAAGAPEMPEMEEDVEVSPIPATAAGEGGEVPDRVGAAGTLPARPHPRPRPHPDIDDVIVDAAQISARIAELATRVDADYAGREILLVGVLKGAVMVMADFSRALTAPLTMDFMAVSSYGSATSSSGVVRILKDLDRSIEGRDVLVVEDIIDSGLTLSWLLKNLRSRNPASLEVLALFRKPEAKSADVDVRYVGFDIPSAFVVGYGLDYGERYRTLPFVGTLTREAITRIGAAGAA